MDGVFLQFGAVLLFLSFAGVGQSWPLTPLSELWYKFDNFSLRARNVISPFRTKRGK